MSNRERFLAVKISGHSPGRYRLIRAATPEERTDQQLNPEQIVVLFHAQNYRPVVSLIRGGTRNWVVDAFGIEVEPPRRFLCEWP